MGHLIVIGITAAVTVALLAIVIMRQSGRTGGPPGPLARRLGPFLDLLDARYAPLLFVATPQAYTVYAWLLADSAPTWVAVMGGIGFEFVYVGAIAWAERGAGWEAARTPAITALLFSVGVAVAHYGQTSGALAILHVGFPLVGYTYTRMMHTKPAGPDPAQLAQELEHMKTEVAQEARDRDTQAREAKRAWSTAEQFQADAAQLSTDLAQARAEADHWRGMAAQAAQAAQAPALTADHETIQVGQAKVSVRGLVRELEAAGHRIPRTTLSRVVERAQESA